MKKIKIEVRIVHKHETIVKVVLIIAFTILSVAKLVRLFITFLNILSVHFSAINKILRHIILYPKFTISALIIISVVFVKKIAF